MEIRNLMEEIVEKTVLEVSEEEKREGRIHTTPECLTDVACFVLNRIPQHYISSGRGGAHGEKELKENPQLTIDVMTLVHEGFKRISSVARSYYFNTADEPMQCSGPLFIFPVFKGRLIDCVDFSAAKGVEIVMKTPEDEPVKMLDARWQNPFFLDPKIEGNYLFLPQPQPAADADEEKLFEFKLTVDAKGFEPFTHFFKIGLTAKTSFKFVLGGVPDYRIEDLYLLRS